MTYSVIQKSQLEGANRLDAEYYQPKYLKIRNNIKKIGFFSFSEIIKSFGSGKNLQQTENVNSPKFIRTQNVRPVIVDSSGMSYSLALKYPKLNYGDLLFVRVGEGVGNSSIVTRNFENSTFSDNVIRIKVKKLNPFYISILLNSKIGSLLMESIKKGSARSLISKENLDSLRIPKLSKEKQAYFEKIVNKAAEQVMQSENFYSQAENLLLDELGLKDYKIEDNLSCVINLSDAKSVDRMDAEYFQPKYEKLISKIKTKNAKSLSELVSLKKGVEPGSEKYQEEGKLFIRVSSLSKYGVNDNNQKYLTEELYQKLQKDFKPKAGEILLTKDATPGIAYLLKESVEGIIAGGILRLKVKENIDAEYLTLCINSIIGQFQAERDAGGSVISHWKPEQIKKIQIPILPRSTQQKIADLVRKSHEARKKSKELLEEAKRKIEEMIEEGEEKND
jgi:restriction endonuclease S subunit